MSGRSNTESWKFLVVESRALESENQHKDNGIPLMIGINLVPRAFPLKNGWGGKSPGDEVGLESGILVPLTMNPAHSAWNPESQAWDPEFRGASHLHKPLLRLRVVLIFPQG